MLYNTAVQSFVRRDHLKTHAALSRLLSTLKGQSRKQARRRWHDLGPGSIWGLSAASAPSVDGAGSTASDSREPDIEVEEWLIKTFKLYISAHASLYTDPPSSSSANALSPDLIGLIPPNPPSRVLEQVANTALQAYPDGILPPPVISTLILASLKLQPQDDALGYVHRVTEEWLANLPNAFMEGISVRERGGVSKRVEAGREGYLKVLELFTGEVLAREGEWEMARGILDGDTLMGSKRKEVSYLVRRGESAHDRRYTDICVPAKPAAKPRKQLLPQAAGSFPPLLPRWSFQTHPRTARRRRLSIDLVRDLVARPPAKRPRGHHRSSPYPPWVPVLGGTPRLPSGILWLPLDRTRAKERPNR